MAIRAFAPSISALSTIIPNSACQKFGERESVYFFKPSVFRNSCLGEGKHNQRYWKVEKSRFQVEAMSGRIQPIKPKEGQESVWDYPRPPRCEPVSAKIQVVFNGETILETTGAYRILETSHPPTYYLPRDDFKPGSLQKSQGGGGSYCEWKGSASYWDIVAGSKVAPRVAWSYENPTPGFAAIKGYIALYAGPMDACYVGGEKVTPQPGGFYGGWITSNIVGPFKGGAGSMGW